MKRKEPKDVDMNVIDANAVLESGQNKMHDAEPAKQSKEIVGIIKECCLSNASSSASIELTEE